MNNIVFCNNNKVLTSSRVVATYFDKEHKNVLRDIRKLIEELGSELSHETDSSEMSHEISNYFIESTYISSRGREEVEYLLTKNGFTLLTMGFRGPKALRFKLDYISAYDAMEQALIKLKEDYLELEVKLAEKDKEVLERTLSRTILELEEAEEKCYTVESHYEELVDYNKQLRKKYDELLDNNNEWIAYAEKLKEIIINQKG